MRLVGSNESRIEKQKVKDEIGWKQRTGRGNGGETTLLHMLKDEVDVVVYLVDAYDKERFDESKKELDALLSDESLQMSLSLSLETKLIFHMLPQKTNCVTIWALSNFATGKGKVNLPDSNVRPMEVFMCSIVKKMGYGDGFKWVSQYIK